MMRSFRTRLVNSVAQVVVLVPCLLIYLACATPFAIEKLQEGMTTETVREKFGDPESIETGPFFFGDSCWRYVHEVQDWEGTWFPLTPVFIPFFAAFDRWDALYVRRRPVLLHFKGEKLVRWELIEPVRTGSTARLVDWGPPMRFEHAYYELTFSTCEEVEKSRTFLPRMGETGYVTRNLAALWSAPTTSSERKAFLDRDQRVKFLERKDQWCHVEDDSGSDGWISCVFLTASEPR